MADVLELFPTGTGAAVGGKAKKSEDDDVLSMFPTEAPSLPKEAEPAPSLGPLHSKPDAGTAAFMRIYGAAGEGYQNTPPLLTPEARAAVEKGGPVGRYVVNPLLDLGSMVFKGLGAFGGAVGQSGAEVGTATGRPELGRDINMLAQVAPLAEMGAGVPRIPSAPEAPAAPPRFVQEYYGEGTAANPLAANPPKPAPAFVPPGTNLPPEPLYRTPEGPNYQGGPIEPPAPSPAFVPPEAQAPPRPAASASAAPEPRSVGAAGSREGTPASQIEMTPAEMKANRRQAELGEILAPAEPGDTTLHVKGSLPTKAEYSGDPEVSQQENLLRQRNPKLFEGEGGRLTENNTARVAHYEDMTPSDTTLERWTRERGEQAAKDNEAIVANAKPADAQPVVDTLDGILNDKRNMNRESVQKNLGAYRERLFDKDGTLKSDPQELWGIRDDLTEKLDKIGKDPQSTMGYVKKETLAIRDAIDQSLNAATDGRFQTFLDNYAAKSQQINAGHLLREFRADLTNAKGDILANRFHNFVKDLAENRGKGGIDPAMDISDETMGGLIALDKDLKRAGLIDLGKARGSPTNMYGAVAKAMGLGAAHAVTATVAPSGMGNLLLQGIIDRGSQIGGHILLNRKTQQHLAPPPGGYRNPLQPPT